MEVYRLLESIRRAMKTVLDPASEQDRNCAYATARTLIMDIEEHIRDEKPSETGLLEDLKKLKYHLRVLAYLEGRGEYLEIQHYKLALDLINALGEHPDFKPAESRQEPLPPLFPKFK